MFQSKNFICSCCKTEQHDGTFLTTKNNKNWRYVCCFCIPDELTERDLSELLTLRDKEGLES